MTIDASRGRTWLAMVLFFLSGAAALVYEISWTRQIGLIVGQTADAAAIVLASYLGGMALGYLLGERWRSRVPPLRGYAVAELSVAAWACAVPLLLVLSESRLISAVLASDQTTIRMATRAVFSAAVLLPGTIALGATLPFMAAFVTTDDRRSASAVPLAYAMNTAGAFAGVLAATFWLLAHAGVRASSLLAAGCSGVCGVAALVLGHCDSSRPTSSNSSHGPKDPSCHALPGSLRWPAVAALSGFGTLALEILYTRLFSLVFHNSTYTFGVVVAAFLLSLAVGSAAVAGFSRRFSTEALICFGGLGGAAAIPGSVMLFVRMTGFRYFHFGDTFHSYVAGAFGLALLVVAPPIALLGMILPAAWKAAAAHPSNTESVGRLAAINTFAGAAGALLAALFVRPWLGLWGAFWLVAALMAGIPLVAGIHRRMTYGITVGLSVLFGGLLMTTTATRALESGLDAGKDVVRRWESAHGWIDVVRDKRNQSFQVRQNLHYGHGFTGTTAVRERRQGHLPLLLHPQPEEVLFLGLGTGITASAVPAHLDVRRATIVELIPEVVEAARELSEFNEGVVDAPNVEVRIDDARHFLATSGRQFDVIVSDLYVPWESETGYLYTVEHYTLVREQLKAGGLFCQWLPLYQVGTREFELIADSFAAVFPSTELWWGQIDSRRPIIALIGTHAPLRVASHDLNSRIAAVESLSNGSDPYLASATLFRELNAGAWPRRLDRLLNTDEHPRVEFMAPVSQRQSTLLQGRRLRAWFDEVLPKLSEPAQLDGEQSPSESQRRRVWVRFLLFGESPASAG